MGARTFDIRIAGVDDVPALAQIGSQAFRDAYGGTAPDADIARHVEEHFSAAAIAREIGRDDVTYMQACDGAALAGLVKTRDSSIPDLVAAAAARSAIEVQQLYVATGFQRRGVGAALMDAVVAVARKRSIDGIWLSVWTEADWATRFYEKYGFRSLGEVAFLLADVEYTDYLMWLPLED